MSVLEDFLLLICLEKEDSDFLMKVLGVEHAHAIVEENENEEGTSRRTRRQVHLEDLM